MQYRRLPSWAHSPVRCAPQPHRSTLHISAAALEGLFRSEEELNRLPASERIRYRLIGADCRYHANDNISAYIREGELEELKAEVQRVSTVAPRSAA